MVDVIILILLLAAVAVGYSRGLICALVGLVGNVAALLLAFFLAESVALATGEKTGAVAALSDRIQKILPLPQTLEETLASTDGVSAFYTYLNGLHLPQGLKQNLLQNIQDQVHTMGEGVFMTMSQTVGNALAQYLWQGVVFVVLWFILGLVIIGGSRLIMGAIHHIPLVGKVDRLLGSVVMVFLVALTVAVLYHTLGIFVETGASSNGFLAAINQSKLLPMLQGVLQKAMTS